MLTVEQRARLAVSRRIAVLAAVDCVDVEIKSAAIDKISSRQTICQPAPHQVGANNREPQSTALAEICTGVCAKLKHHERTLQQAHRGSR